MKFIRTYFKNIIKLNCKTRKIFAFTLAEVLITLGIIGIVAALTIPTLIQNEQEKSTVTALKKAYSTLENAYNLAVQKEGGTPDTWDLDNNHDRILTYLVPYLRVQKDCTDGSKGCFPPVMYNGLSGSQYINYDSTSNIFKIRLADGTSIGAAQYSQPKCTQSRGNTQALNNLCGEYYIDINGDKKPNELGKDLFYFYLSKYGIIPVGTANDTLTFENQCATKPTFAWSCAAWVLYNENMDYLHCNDLSWTGKLSCK